MFTSKAFNSATLRNCFSASPLKWERCEDRILFDAAMDIDPSVVQGTDTPEPQQNGLAALQPAMIQVSSGSQVATSTRRELVVVDTSVGNYQQFVDDIASNQSGDARQLDLLLIDGADALDTLTDTLLGYSDLDAIHFIVHGREHAFRLGDLWISNSTMEEHGRKIEVDPNYRTTGLDRKSVAGC